MNKRPIVFTKGSQDQYMQDLIDTWENQLTQYQEYASEATGEAATAFEDEMIRLEAKIEQMKERLLEMEAELSRRKSDLHASDKK